MNTHTKTPSHQAMAALLSAALAAFTLPASAEVADEVAGRIVTGDSRYEVIAKVGKHPTWIEIRRYVGIETQVLTFRIGLSETLIVRLVLGRVVTVETKSVSPWDFR